jgi:acetolactate synthase-1/2/3 large subunit
MGHAIPGAIGAALMGAPTLVLVGDAEFLMSGMELHTAVENRLPVVVLVLNDAGHGMVRIGARAHCGGIAPPTDFTCPPDLVELGRALGAHGCRVFTEAELEQSILTALCRPGPTLVDVPISRDATPPLGARLAALSQAFGLGDRC